MKAKLIFILNTHVLKNALNLFYFLCNPYCEPVKVKVLLRRSVLKSNTGAQQ